jgi:hypothetical protein
MPARASARLAASTGAMPNTSGSTANVPRPAIRASGSSPAASAPCGEPISSAPAPSFSGDALPAVMVPPNAGLSLPSFSTLVSGRMPSSRACSESSSGTGTTHGS